MFSSILVWSGCLCVLMVLHCHCHPPLPPLHNSYNDGGFSPAVTSHRRMLEVGGGGVEVLSLDTASSQLRLPRPI